MKINRIVSLVLAVAMCLSALVFSIPAAAETIQTAVNAEITKQGNTWTLENAGISAALAFENGSLKLTSLYNKAAGKEYLTGNAADNYLFSYLYGEYKSENFETVKSDDGNWVLGDSEISVIDMIEEAGKDPTPVGKKVSIVITNQQKMLQVTVIFEIYDGVAGIRYYTKVKNLSDKEMTIKEADVISLNLPNDPHNIHYSQIETMEWASSTGPLPKNTGRNAVCLYDSGDGWWMMPEVNWKTQIGPKNKQNPKHNDPSNLGKNPEFASISAWSGDNKVKVSTNPQSVQLTLFAGEEFDYIPVNINVFKGDIVDGKMCAEEHFRKRFKFHHTTTILNTNDWDYINKRSFEYFRDVIIPKAKIANADMIMLDDLWNTTRDSIVAKPSLRSLEEFSEMVKSQGFMLGLWFNLAGDDHMQGRDLADPVKLAEKIGHIETLITEYGMDHQMIDLTEYWQNVDETSYSHPDDNVYRKNVMVRNALNELVRKYPNYLVKFTNEIDIYPTQGNRNNGLLHMIDNGWLVVNGGLGAGLPCVATSFGYLPLNAQYYGGGVTGNMAEYYSFMAARNIKLYTDPGTQWTDWGTELLGIFNTWRKSPRIKALTDNSVVRPAYLGPGWDSPKASDWNIRGPYAWMYVSEDKNDALMIATTIDKNKKQVINTDVRWLDPAKTYVVSDVTLDNNGLFSLAYLGTYSGADLVSNGFDADLNSSLSGGKAYYFKAVEEDNMLVAYADEKVHSYTAEQNGNSLTVTVTGNAGDTAAFIVANAANNTGRVVKVTIGEDGSRTVVIPAEKLRAPKKTSFEDPIAPIRYEFEDLVENNKIEYNPDNNTDNRFTGNNTDSNPSGGKYSFVYYGADNNYINVKIDAPATGKYKVSFAGKTNENAAMGAIGQNGEPISKFYEFCTTPLNVFRTVSCDLELQKGENIIQIFAKRGATKSTSISLRLDYVEIQAIVAADPVVIEAEDIFGQLEFSNKNLASVKEFSGVSFVDYNSPAAAEWIKVPVTSDKPNSYTVAVNYKTGPQYGQIQLFIGGKKQGAVFDQYSPSEGFGKAQLGTITFDKAGTMLLEFLIIGRHKDNTRGFAANLDSIELISEPSVYAKSYGDAVVSGSTVDLKEILSAINLQEKYNNAGSLIFEVFTETDFDVAEIDENGVLTANNAGTAVVRVYNKYNQMAYADYTLTVIQEGTEQAVINAIKAINQIGKVEYTEKCLEAITAAEEAYNKLSQQQKSKVTNYSLLVTARREYELLKVEDQESKIPQAVVYVEDTDYIADLGSTIKKNTCPSGSHVIKFTSDQQPFEHGFGFEPAGKDGSVVGTMLIPIPAGATHFSAHVGVDYAQSDPSSEYDQQNVVTFRINGVEVFKTERILKNIENGVEVDKSQYVEFEIPSDADWLLIENDTGTNNICDHVIFADAKFFNKPVVEVIEKIAVITPENVNVSAYSKEIADRLVAAEEAYYALSPELRRMVTNLDKMLTSRTMLALFGMNGTGENDPGLKQTDPEAAARVENVNNLISQIPPVDEVTSEHKAIVEAAYEAYNELSDTEKTYVSEIHNMILAVEKLQGEPPIEIIIGDADGDGRVTVSDIVAVRNHIMDRIKLSGNALLAANADQDAEGNITVADIIAIRRIIMNQY
ncbi:MAG TPA: hypothetical protein GXX17_01915 [Clostridiales bacterium]|nr:hypothetical protein [Clostridiales bacterium]